jgi:hypothetical protein
LLTGPFAAFSSAFRDLVPFALELLAAAIAFHFSRRAIEDVRRPPAQSIAWSIGIVAVVALLPFYSRPAGDIVDPANGLEYTRSRQDAAALAIHLLMLLTLASVAGLAKGWRRRRGAGTA